MRWESPFRNGIGTSLLYYHPLMEQMEDYQFQLRLNEQTDLGVAFCKSANNCALCSDVNIRRAPACERMDNRVGCGLPFLPFHRFFLPLKSLELFFCPFALEALLRINAFLNCLLNGMGTLCHPFKEKTNLVFKTISDCCK